MIDMIMADWAAEDWLGVIAGVFLLIHPICSAITQYTQTPKDDTAYGWFYNNVIRVLALNKGYATQDTPK